MGEALVVTSGKGGVGKSTLAVNLAAALALAGSRTALVDADTGLRSLDVMLGLENNVVYDLTDVAEGVCRLRQAVLRCPAVPGLSMMAASQLRDAGSVSREKMKDIAGQLKESFEYVIIDCPAGVDAGFRIAAAGADRALIVTQIDPVCVRDAERVKGLLERAGVGKTLLAVNRVRREKPKKEEPYSWDALAQRLELPLVGLVGEDEAFSQAAQAGRPAVLDHEDIMKTFEEMARRLKGENLPVKPLKPLGFWQWLMKDYKD
ncbi:MAG: septum site-determining protein MinD [Clostridia bacterium]|nr:septum site-determining protein MinD [Clostridia bacterium]